MTNNNCIFCKILKKEIPASVVYEDELVSAFMDVMPFTKGHLLVIPKEHGQLIGDIEEKTAARMFEVGRKLNGAIRRSGIKSEGINFMMADGPAAGQEIFHSHLHCIPRNQGDGFGFKRPPGYGKMAERDDLDALAEEIKKNL